jgi:hypothetical protein
MWQMDFFANFIFLQLPLIFAKNRLCAKVFFLSALMRHQTKTAEKPVDPLHAKQAYPFRPLSVHIAFAP